MKYPRIRLLACLIVPLILSSVTAPLHAQVQAPSQKAEAAAPAVQLDPFVVTTSRDVGFVASSALAGGRLATDLKDTPAAYSVLTREFIDALNLNNLTDAVKWTVNSNNIPDDGRNTLFASEQSSMITFRGVASNQQQIDFFPVYYDYDSYNLERFDFARGPNSILFGNGSFGGTPNANLKRAALGQTIRQTRVTIGSWDSYRATVDLNQPINSSLALRTNLVWQDNHTWRDREFDRKLAGAIGLTYQPWRNGRLSVNAERGQFDRNNAVGILGDRISGWDGTTTFSAPLTTIPSTANATGITRNGSSTAAYPVYIPALASAGLVNWANSAVTLGGNANAAVPVGGKLVVGGGVNLAGNPILDTVNVPANAYNLAIAGSEFDLPGRSFTNTVSNRTFRQDYQNYTATFNQQVGQHLFLEAAGNYAYANKITDYTPVRGLTDTYIDINRNLPTGAANPNFLQPYNEAVRFYNTTGFIAHNYRVGAALVFDDTRWGDYRLNILAGTNRRTGDRNQYVYTLLDPTLDSRDWSAQNNIRYRYYWNVPDRPENDIGSVTYTDPTSGSTRTVPTGFVLDTTRPGNTNRNRELFTYGQAAFNARLFQEQLHLLAAVRRDGYEVTPSTSEFRRDYAAGWNGSTIVYRPVAPSDYFRLTYVPKDASGNVTGAAVSATARPRDGSGNPLPQYAGDRFQDDFSAPRVKGTVDTFSLGGVYHATPWVSLIANYAETYNPPSAAVRINGGVYDPLLSKGWDAGLRFTLGGGKAILTFTQYSGKQENVSIGTGTGDGLPVAIPGALNSIIEANVIGDFRPDGVNNRGVASVPFVYFDTARRETEGYELEFVANLRPGWRLLANAGLPKSSQSDGYADTRAYLAANDGLLRQILGDAGVTIGSDNVATVNASIPLSQQSPDASSAAAAWNNLQAARANFVTDSQPITRLGKVSANLYTDYTFQTGRLKGLRLGGGVNYRGREVIGFRGADSIVNQSNPTTAIDDPTVGALTPVYRSGYRSYTVVGGYTFKLEKGRSIQVDLTISNLLNEDRPIYYNTVQRAPDGNLSTPARVATPNQYYYLTPRAYSLSATVNF